MNLITGATGLVGSHLALKLLQQGKSVIATKRFNSDCTKTKILFSYYTPDFEKLYNKIKWIDADVCDIFSIIDALEGIDTVYHCAGFVSFNEKNKKEMYRINVMGTANVVNACLEKKIKTLCHVSTIGTLQNPDIIKNIDESVYWKSSPHANDYAISKYNAEREVWRGIEEGLNAIIVNPGVILGPGFWSQSSGKLVQTCYKGLAFYTKGSTGFIDARDVAECMVCLVEKEHFNKRFILTENNYSFKYVFSELHKGFRKKEPRIEAGKLMLNFAKWMNFLISFLTGKEPSITKASVHAGLQETTYNNNKIKEVIHFNFIPFSETLKFVCKTYSSDIKKLNNA